MFSRVIYLIKGKYGSLKEASEAPALKGGERDAAESPGPEGRKEIKALALKLSCVHIRNVFFAP